MSVIAGNYDITVYQGDTYDMTFIWSDENENPLDLTGYTSRLQVRESIDASTTMVSLSSGSGITLGGAAGTIQVVISDTATAALTQSGVYDLEIESGSGVVTTILYGAFTLIKEVTR